MTSDTKRCCYCGGAGRFQIVSSVSDHAWANCFCARAAPMASDTDTGLVELATDENFYAARYAERCGQLAYAQSTIAAYVKATGFDHAAACPICDGIEGCSHSFGERFAALSRPSADGPCDLCAGKCRGHSLGDERAWEPEPGSRAYAEQQASRPSADFAAVVEQCASKADELARLLRHAQRGSIGNSNRLHEAAGAEAAAAAIRSIQAPDEGGGL